MDMNLNGTKKQKFTPVNKIHFTAEMDAFLKDNYSRMNNRELADALGLRLTSTRHRLYQLGLKRIEMEYWTEEQVLFLRRYYKKMGDTEIAEIFNEEFPKNKNWCKRHIAKKRSYMKLKRTPDEIAFIKKRNIKQGRYSESHYKRWLGRKAEVGTEKVWIIGGSPTKVIKTSKGFIRLSVYNWQKTYGKIPKRHVIRHIDGNTLNCDLSNLECISRAKNMEKNSGSVQRTDNYIAGIMARGDKQLKASILATPELIELKRNQLKLQRHINGKTK